MDLYLLLRFVHVVGFIALGGGLLAVFVSELRAYRTGDIQVFAEAARYTATFYDALVLPGAALVAVSGFFLVLELGLGFFSEPWVMGMWGLFLFEFVEGNTLTRIQFQRTLRRSRAALAQGGPLTDAIRDDARTFLGQAAHFLDIPLFLVIVYCGVARPAGWGDVGLALALALIATAALTWTIPRMAPRAQRA